MVHGEHRAEPLRQPSGDDHGTLTARVSTCAAAFSSNTPVTGPASRNTGPPYLELAKATVTSGVWIITTVPSGDSICSAPAARAVLSAWSPTWPGSGITANRENPVPYTPIHVNPSRIWERGNPANRPGSVGPIPDRMSATSGRSAAVMPTPGAGFGVTADRAGRLSLSCRKLDVTTARLDPRAKTCTATGSPFTGSVQMSTAAMVVRGSVALTRSPAASIPAIRRDGSRDRRPDPVASASSLRPSAGGSRSAALGSRTGGKPSILVSRLRL